MANALLLLSRLAAPTEPHSTTPISEARSALHYWSQRADALPWHRRAARREARVMIATARARLISAHLRLLGLRWVEALVAPFLDTGGRSPAAHVRSLALGSMRRTALGRRILIGAGVAAAGLLTLVCLGAALATHLIAL
jgi:hypothetical protein